jgi:hypothetical protein
MFLGGHSIVFYKNTFQIGFQDYRVTEQVYIKFLLIPFEQSGGRENDIIIHLSKIDRCVSLVFMFDPIRF